MQDSKTLDRLSNGAGFIAALDQSGGSTPKALKGYGIEEDAWNNEEGMFGLIHQMRSRVITSPAFGGDKVLGAILFERTMDGEVDGKPTPAALLERDVLPFIKIDIIFLTHQTQEKNVTSAIAKMEGLSTVCGSVTKIRLENLS